MKVKFRGYEYEFFKIKLSKSQRFGPHANKFVHFGYVRFMDDEIGYSVRIGSLVLAVWRISLDVYKQPRAEEL